MIFDADLRTYLISVDAIRHVVGDSVFGIIKPQGQRPFPELLLNRTQTTRQQKFCGTDKLVNAEFTIDCCADQANVAFALAKLMRQWVDGFTGMMGQTYVNLATLTNEYPVDDPDPGIIRLSQTFNFWYVED